MIVAIIEYEMRPGAEQDFERALQAMQARLESFDGFLGETSCSRLGHQRQFVTLSYWRDRSSLKAWREDAEHREVQRLGRDVCFTWYRVRICELEREYDWSDAP